MPLPKYLPGPHHPVVGVLLDGELEALVHGVDVGSLELLQTRAGLVRRLERDVRLALLHGESANFPDGAKKESRKKGYYYLCVIAMGHVVIFSHTILTKTEYSLKERKKKERQMSFLGSPGIQVHEREEGGSSLMQRQQRHRSIRVLR